MLAGHLVERLGFCGLGLSGTAAETEKSNLNLPPIVSCPASDWVNEH
jgi:hypothetical protein